MSEYRVIAQRRTVVSQLQRILLDRYIAADTPPKEKLVCEEVFVAESEVSQEVLMDIFDDLQTWENHLRQQMNEFKWRKEEKKLPFLKDREKPPSAEAKKNGTEKKPKGSKRKKAPESEAPAGDGGEPEAAE